MFNKRLKQEAIEKLEETIEVYNSNVVAVQKKAEELFNLRQESGIDVIQSVENYINQLANSPKEFDKSFSAYKMEFKEFNNFVKEFNVDAAIASLSGAAAMNAALTWLGAGMARGAVFLALAGPIGAGIGAFSLFGGGLYASSKNKKTTQDANDKRKEIEAENTVLNAAKLEISELFALTEKYQNGVQKLLKELEASTPKEYSAFSDEEKQKLGALINHINALSTLLNRKVE